MQPYSSDPPTSSCVTAQDCTEDDSLFCWPGRAARPQIDSGPSRTLTVLQTSFTHRGLVNLETASPKQKRNELSGLLAEGLRDGHAEGVAKRNEKQKCPKERASSGTVRRELPLYNKPSAVQASGKVQTLVP